MIDGVFTHYLVNELKDNYNLINKRINKFGSIKESDFFLTLSNKAKLLFSIDSNTQNIRITNLELTNNQKLSNFHKVLKKYLESSIIKDIKQYNNDRIIDFYIASFDEMGYLVPIHLIIELFGRNGNIILTLDDYTIIDCYKRQLENQIGDRIIIPKYKYHFPENDKINPFTNKNALYNLEGVSQFLQNQIDIDSSTDIIFDNFHPVIIKNNSKNHFYCFDLSYIEGDRLYFDSLSLMLDYYYINIKLNDTKNLDQIYLSNFIKKEIEKIKSKLSKQENEIDSAKDNLKYEKIGNLLKANLYLIKKGDKEIKVFDYYNNNETLLIELNPKLSPNENLVAIFNKYQKAKRAIQEIDKQIINSKHELEYFECLLNQVAISKQNDYFEIFQELNLNNKIKEKPKKSKPNFLTFETNNGDLIFVGKNNIQNNYLTNTFAKPSDYFFHVQNIPGSHVIVRTNNLTDELVYLASSIASYYSTYRYSTNVCVDYTLVKNVKKIPGVPGSFVTYKNYKSCFGKPDLDFINKNVSIK